MQILIEMKAPGTEFLIFDGGLMTLERQHLEAPMAYPSQDGDAWLLYTPAKLPTKSRKSLWQTEHGKRTTTASRRAGAQTLNTCILSVFVGVNRPVTGGLIPRAHLKEGFSNTERA